MTSENMLALIETHNMGVAGFKQFCEKLDEVNGGGFTANKWFQLFLFKPDFSRHAGLLVRQARGIGINAKYNAQDGEITVYEPKASIYCEKCAETDYIYSANLNEVGNDLEIRFDTENAQLDVILLSENIDESININYCPFCGIKLRETETSK